MPNTEAPLLLIRCPSCGQRFKVADDLRGRTVECGGCEHRFRINDDTIVRGQKFYPGERRDSRLNQFQRVPLAMTPEVTGVAPVHYSDAPDPLEFEPISPQRVVAGVLAVVTMVLMALLLMFGAHRGGSLDGMVTANRLLMAGFTGLLGTGLLVYANPRGRIKSIAVGVVLSCGLLALPFFFTEGSVVLSDLELQKAPPANRVPAPDEATERMRTLRDKINTAPLEAEIARLAGVDSKQRAVGLWLRGLREQDRLVIRDYILRATDADPQSHYYSRGGGDFLMVVTGTTLTLDEVAERAAAIGTVENLYKELAVAEVRINNNNFVAGPIDKLTNQEQPEFYQLNKRELESIDLDRVEHAVQRLADAPPKIYRNDITRKLIELLETKEVEFKKDLCRALLVWSDQPGPASAAALKEVNNLLGRKAKVPPEMVALIVKEQNPGAVALLDRLWSQDSTAWESLYSELGAAAEPTLLKHLDSDDGMVRQSAVRLLGRVGGAASVPALEAAKAGAGREMQVLLDQALAAIQSRLKQ